MSSPLTMEERDSQRHTAGTPKEKCHCLIVGPCWRESHTTNSRKTTERIEPVTKQLWKILGHYAVSLWIVSTKQIMRQHSQRKQFLRAKRTKTRVLFLAHLREIPKESKIQMLQNMQPESESTIRIDQNGDQFGFCLWVMI